MKLQFLIFLSCLPVFGSMLNAQISNYTSLDQTQPIEFFGDRIRYDNKEIILSPKTLFIDGRLSDQEIAGTPYVFNNFNEASTQFIAGTEDEPMCVYIAPYVYWIDDPDDSSVRVGKDGREPFGLIIKCPYLHIVGLNSEPQNIVLAANRGQTQGAVGNFTMFDFWGDGLVVKNLTMGNYCNVDLDYPLKKELSRKKRTFTTTQAHIAYCHGDKIIAENVHFLSRLNMNPLSGAKRILFNNCHMESTDDALTSTGVYLNCTFDFYGQRPFWRSDIGGTVFLNCDFTIGHDGDRQYFCKSVGPLSIIDCRFHARKPIYAGWTQDPTEWLRCYQYNVKVNGMPYIIGAQKPYNTISMEQLNLLKAFRLTNGDKVLYNTYNLLKGADDWDPQSIKEQVTAISSREGADYTNMATCLSVDPLVMSVQTGKQPLKLVATVKRHNNYILNNVPVRWKIQQGYEKDIKLSVSEGYECIVEATNKDDEAKLISIIAYTEDGLECASELTVTPDYIPAPSFIALPELAITKGVAIINYTLDLKNRKDESLITWYRCTDHNGANKIPVSVSRLNKPEYTYTLTKEDIGYYIMASISPKHIRCLPGEEYFVVSKSPIKKKQVNISNIFETNFQNFPSKNQPQLLPGFWTISGFKPLDTDAYNWEIYPDKDYWIYDSGINGAYGTGLLQDQRGARLLYTPLEGLYKDMEITLNVDATKTAGQGFGSPTGQYLDLYIKFDTKTLTGYALRIIRTTKYSNAVDFVLVKYENGRTEEISKPVSTICYRTDCTIRLKAIGNKLTAHAETTTQLPPLPTDSSLKPSVEIEADITSNTFGGTGIQHTGTCGESTTMLHYMKIEWK